MEQLAIQLLGNSPNLIVCLLLWAEIKSIKAEVCSQKEFCHEWRKEHVRQTKK